MRRFKTSFPAARFGSRTTPRASPPDFPLMQDSNSGYNLPQALAIGRALDELGYHVACAARNTTMIEVHHPVFRFGLKRHPLDVGPDGHAILPTSPGLGVELDWNWLEAHTDGIRVSGAAVGH